MYNASRPLGVSDIRDAYSLIGAKYNQDAYRIYDVGSLIRAGIKRDQDVSSYIFDFIGEQGEVLGISNIVNGRVLFTKFKSLKEKKFLTYGPVRQIPYGLGDMKNFKYGDYIVLVEGEKDRDSLRMCYPYVCSVGTSGTGTVMREVLLTMTNRFVLYYDNDEAGQKSIWRDRKFFLSRNCQVEIGKHLEGVKDSGTIADYLYQGREYDYEYLKAYYTLQLQSLTCR